MVGGSRCGVEWRGGEYLRNATLASDFKSREQGVGSVGVGIGVGETRRGGLSACFEDSGVLGLGSWVLGLTATWCILGGGRIDEMR